MIQSRPSTTSVVAGHLFRLRIRKFVPSGRTALLGFRLLASQAFFCNFPDLIF